MATALQALLRRGAAAPPSLALLRPPLSPGRYSAPRSPLLAATAAAAADGLPDVRRPQLSPASVPSLLRYFSSKPSKECAPPPGRRPPTSSKGTPRQEQRCAPLPEWQPPTSSKETSPLEQGEEFLIGVLEDLKKLNKQSDILVEALDYCRKATAKLCGKWNDKSVAMYENGLEKAFKALAVYEKSLDDFSGALTSSNALSKDILQKIQMAHKERIDATKVIRQELNDGLALFMTLKMRKKVIGVGLSTSHLILKKLNELSSKFKGTIAVVSGICFVLSVMIIVKFLV